MNTTTYADNSKAYQVIWGDNDVDLAVKASRHARQQLSKRRVVQVTTTKIAGPNTPCPCGSGLKFKRCHGQYRMVEVSIRPIGSVPNAVTRTD